MKTKIKQELKNKDVSELRKQLADTRKTLYQARLDQSQFKLKNTRSLTHTRKEIAVILTLLKEKELNNDKNI